MIRRLDVDAGLFVLCDNTADNVVLNEHIKCNHFVFLLCKEGRSVIEVNYATYVLRAGELFLLTPFDIFQVKEFAEETEIKVLMIPNNVVANLINDIDISYFEEIKHNPLIRISKEYYDAVVSVYSLLGMLYSLLEYDQFVMIAEKQVVSMIRIIKCSFSSGNNGFVSGREYVSRKRELFRKFVKELVNSHSTSREVLFYANELGISSGYLNEICNEVSGHSAKEVIDFTVVTRLKHELSYSSKSIQELADEYNFPNQSYLSRYYKRITGKKPSEFRKG